MKGSLDGLVLGVLFAFAFILMLTLILDQRKELVVLLYQNVVLGFHLSWEGFPLLYYSLQSTYSATTS